MSVALAYSKTCLCATLRSCAPGTYAQDSGLGIASHPTEDSRPWASARASLLQPNPSAVKRILRPVFLNQAVPAGDHYAVYLFQNIFRQQTYVVVESAGGAPALGSGGLSVASAPGLNPASLTVFPPAAHRTGRAALPHPALQADHATRTRTTASPHGASPVQRLARSLFPLHDLSPLAIRPVYALIAPRGVAWHATWLLHFRM